MLLLKSERVLFEEFCAWLVVGFVLAQPLHHRRVAVVGKDAALINTESQQGHFHPIV
jgi:hypothetical protein